MNTALRKTSTRLAVALAAAGALSLLAPAARADGPITVTVAQLQATPLDYDEKVVSVTGTVEQASPAGSESAYNLRDGAAKVTVVSRQAAPHDGDKLVVVGTVRVFGGAGEDPDDPHDKFPPAVFEASRATAP